MTRPVAVSSVFCVLGVRYLNYTLRQIRLSTTAMGSRFNVNDIFFSELVWVVTAGPSVRERKSLGNVSIVSLPR